jgi:tripartite-type tricarboxylate transporter receptor subunit TctC
MKLATRHPYNPSIVFSAVLSTTLLFSVGISCAQKFPTKPVRLIVPFSPGGGADLNARRLAEPLGAYWKQTVVVHNMGGAGGNLAVAATTNGEPTGYTLLFASLAIIANNPTLYKGKLAFDVDKDLAPIVIVGEVPLVLMVNSKSPAKDVASLIELAKQRPNKLHFGSGGVGTSMHLTGELLKSTTQIDIVHVPYKGASNVVAAIMGNEIQMIFQNAGLAQSLIKGGRMKALAIASAKRMKILPSVPTFAEIGMPKFRAAITYGIYVRSGTPASTRTQINRDMNAVLKDPAYVAQMTKLGIEVGGGTPRELDDYVAGERKKWVPIIRNIKTR